MQDIERLRKQLESALDYLRRCDSPTPPLILVRSATSCVVCTLGIIADLEAAAKVNPLRDSCLAAMGALEILKKDSNRSWVEEIQESIRTAVLTHAPEDIQVSTTEKSS